MKTTLAFKELVVTAIVGLVFNASPVFAQSNGGNGGKAVRCPRELKNPDGSTRRDLKGNVMVDYNHYKFMVYEYGRSAPEWNLHPIQDIEGNTYFAKALNLVERIKRFNPARAKQYSDELIEISLHFKNNVQDTEHWPMEVTDDTRKFGRCTEGKLFQVFEQEAPNSSYEHRYHLDPENFAMLGEDGKTSIFQQAIMMLHEVIEHETIELGITDADHASHFNAYIFSKEIETATLEQYTDMLVTTGLLYTREVDVNPAAPATPGHKSNWPREVDANITASRLSGDKSKDWTKTWAENFNSTPSDSNGPLDAPIWTIYHYIGLNALSLDLVQAKCDSQVPPKIRLPYYGSFDTPLPECQKIEESKQATRPLGSVFTFVITTSSNGTDAPPQREFQKLFLHEHRDP